MLGFLVAIVLAALVLALCSLAGLPSTIGIAAAFLVLVSAIGTGGYGLRNRGRV